MGKLDDVNAQIKTLAEKISSYQTEDINEQELKDHDQQKDRIAFFSSEIEQVNSLISYLEKVELDELITIHNPFVHFHAYPTISSNFEQSISAIKNFATAQLQELTKDANMLLLQKRSTAIEASKEIQSATQFVKVSQFLSQSENLKPILEQKQLEEAKAKRITQALDEISQLEQSTLRLFESVCKEWTSILDSYEQIIQEINRFSVSKDLVISCNTAFEVDSYQTWLRGSINQQSDKAQGYTNRNVTSALELLTLFDEITQSITDTTIKFKQGYTQEKFTKEFFDNTWFKFKYDVTYDGDNYNAMSQGKKAFVVLKMTLDCSDSKCPIIIDQPEDDLDNRAIFTELVTYLKSKKAQRQIILVTHNANVVVNADSELVIVANQHGSHSPNDNDKKFQYKYGSIECLSKNTKNSATTLDKMRIKEHICEILEGGDKAFKLREKKYNIS